MLGILKIPLMAVCIIVSGPNTYKPYALATDISCKDISNHPSFPLLKQQECGKVRKEVTSRIKSGEDAKLAEFPWMVMLTHTDIVTNTSHILCGGSLISDKYILTSGMCCMGDRELKIASVTLGDYDTSKDSDCVDGRCAPPAVNVTIEEVIVHSAFKKRSYVNDLCLLRLREKITFTEFVSPVCLLTSCEMMYKKLEGLQLEIAGWGRTGYERHGSEKPRILEKPILQKGKTKVLPMEECVSKKERIPPFIICTFGDRYKEARTCLGDFGGPLMYMDDTTSTAYVFGLTSFGKLCDPLIDAWFPTEMPTFYTRVDYYLPWILDTIKA